MKLTKLKSNPNNPRVIRDFDFEKLKKSISTFPKMMELRPIVVDENDIILGGNMRFQALKALGYDEVPNNWVKRASDLTDEQKLEFIIKDNSPYGDWDWDAIANQWDDLPLDDWGLSVPSYEQLSAPDQPASTEEAEPQAESKKRQNMIICPSCGYEID